MSASSYTPPHMRRKPEEEPQERKDKSPNTRHSEGLTSASKLFVDCGALGHIQPYKKFSEMFEFRKYTRFISNLSNLRSDIPNEIGTALPYIFKRFDLSLNTSAINNLIDVCVITAVSKSLLCKLSFDLIVTNADIHPQIREKIGRLDNRLVVVTPPDESIIRTKENPFVKGVVLCSPSMLSGLLVDVDVFNFDSITFILERSALDRFDIANIIRNYSGHILLLTYNGTVDDFLVNNKLFVQIKSYSYRGDATGVSVESATDSEVTSRTYIEKKTFSTGTFSNKSNDCKEGEREQYREPRFEERHDNNPVRCEYKVRETEGANHFGKIGGQNRFSKLRNQNISQPLGMGKLEGTNRNGPLSKTRNMEQSPKTDMENNPKTLYSLDKFTGYEHGQSSEQKGRDPPAHHRQDHMRDHRQDHRQDQRDNAHPPYSAVHLNVSELSPEEKKRAALFESSPKRYIKGRGGQKGQPGLDVQTAYTFPVILNIRNKLQTLGNIITCNENSRKGFIVFFADSAQLNLARERLFDRHSPRSRIRQINSGDVIRNRLNFTTSTNLDLSQIFNYSLVFYDVICSYMNKKSLGKFEVTIFYNPTHLSLLSELCAQMHFEQPNFMKTENRSKELEKRASDTERSEESSETMGEIGF